MTENLWELNKGIIIQIQEAKLIPGKENFNPDTPQWSYKNTKGKGEKNLKAARENTDKEMEKTNKQTF